MLRIAIVGCGKIADEHVWSIQQLPGCSIVGACDRQSLMAAQLCERYDIPFACGGVDELISGCHPDVVHITTPPQSHFPLAMKCLESGCHVYVEKPFTVTAAEAGIVIDAAQGRALRVTVGHNYQFDPAAVRMRTLIASNALGGAPVHVESLYGYDLGGEFGKALLSSRNHWVHSLPGGLLQNVISHALCKIAEFMHDETPAIEVIGRPSKQVSDAGFSHLVDELRVIIWGGATSAYLTFSSQIRPKLHELRVYGPKNSLVVDCERQTLIVLNGSAPKSYLNRLLPPFSTSRQYMANGFTNLSRFFRSELHWNAGLKTLIGLFYQSITAGGPPPIEYREILWTSRVMDEIFRRLG